MNINISNLDKKNNLLNGCTLIYGHFSTIHLGHIRFIKYAKSFQTKLVVALIGDSNSKNESAFPFIQSDRAEALKELNLIDEIIFLNNKELDLVVEKINPENLVLGKEFKKTNIFEIKKSIQIQRENKRNVYFHSGEINYTSNELLYSSELEIFNKKIKQFKGSCKRQKIEYEDMIYTLSNFEKSEIVVIGDTIIDQYINCEAIGMSAEAPVVVVKELSSLNFLGGAAIVASHIKSLGAKTHLVSVTGLDEIAEIVEKELQSKGISNHLIKDPSRPTTLKKRYIVENQKLFRVSKIKDNDVDPEIENKILEIVDKLSASVKCIVISDFVYGVITQKVLNGILNIAKKKNIFIIGDLQCSSQIGAVTKFKEFDLITPNEKEARIALKDKESGLENLSMKLFEKTKINSLIMKLGQDGLIAYNKNKEKIVSEAFPALCPNPIDVTGAGDSLLATIALGVATGSKLMTSVAIGCCVSSLAVKNMGNIAVERYDVEELIKEIFKFD